MASKYVDMVRDALKVPPFKYGTAMGESLNFGFAQFTNKNSLYNKSPIGTAGNEVVQTGFNVAAGAINAVNPTATRVNAPNVADVQYAMKKAKSGLGT